MSDPTKLHTLYAVQNRLPNRKAIEDKKLKQSASDFEALFVQQMLKVMRQTVPQNSLFGKGHGEKLFREMLDAEYAKTISQRPNGLGIKESLMKQMDRSDRITPSQMNAGIKKAQADNNSLKSAANLPIGTVKTPSQ
ncbi:MAG: rod-binding protein [Magnetococcales bacterium]|nr:rod-binding protein [Magnetococcales bacterium]